MATPHGSVVRRFVPAVLLLLLALVLSGCGQRMGKVTGKVSYKGEAVPNGTVVFYGKGDAVSSAPLRPDGTYEATDVPLGEVKVAVSTPPPPIPGALEMAKKNPTAIRKGIVDRLKEEKVVSVPRKFSLPGTSGISLTVTECSQPFDIPLR
jgi:hypothetical protein